MYLLQIPGELLTGIFLRLPNPADLARASAACASFRRLAADRSFLRRYCRIHAPPLLGFLDERQFEKTVSLDSGHLIMGSTGGHLLLYQCGTKSRDAGCFTMDVKTFQLERVVVSKTCTPAMHAYSNFPPSLLSAPTVSSGGEKGHELEMLEQGRAASTSADSSPCLTSADVNAGDQAKD